MAATSINNCCIFLGCSSSAVFYALFLFLVTGRVFLLGHEGCFYWDRKGDSTGTGRVLLLGQEGSFYLDREDKILHRWIYFDRNGFSTWIGRVHRWRPQSIDNTMKYLLQKKKRLAAGCLQGSFCNSIGVAGANLPIAPLQTTRLRSQKHQTHSNSPIEALGATAAGTTAV